MHREKVASETRQALEGKDNNINIDFRIVDPDGSVRHMASRGRAFHGPNGKVVRMSGVR